MPVISFSQQRREIRETDEPKRDNLQNSVQKSLIQRNKLLQP